MPQSAQEIATFDTGPAAIPASALAPTRKAGRAEKARASGDVSRAEETRLLYRLSLVGYLATLLGAFVLGAALWEELSHPLLFGWLGAISIITIARYVLYKVYIAQAPTPERDGFWSSAFVIGAGSMGLAWAFMGTVLLPSDGTFTQMVVLMLVSLLCTGAVAECAPSRPAFLAYVVPALFPLGVHLLLNGGREQMILGSVVLLLGFIILFIHDRANQAVHDALSARVEVNTLTDDLGRSERAVRLTQEALRRESHERKRAEEAERRAAQRLRMHLENTSTGVIEWDRDLRITSWNAAAESIFGHPRTLAVGSDAVDLLVADADRERMRRIWSQTAATHAATTHTSEHVRKDGDIIVCEWAHTPLLDAGNAVFCVASLVQDITERSNRARIDHHMAHHDALTELPNRRLLLDRLGQAVERARQDGRSVALLYVDLDQFKLINDTFGHAAGDTVLREVGKRLHSCVRAADTVSREGGDEFLVALPDLERIEDAQQVISKIREALSRPHEHSGQEFQVTPSIGVSYFPGDADGPESLVKHADAAMYEAKAGGRNTLRGYNDGLDSLLNRRIDMETALRRAVRRGEFAIAYQPQLDVATQRFTTLEVLLRWVDGETGVARSPREFIPVAEEIGLMGPLGGWVMHKAMRQVAEWKRAGHADARVALNLSPQQFLSRSLAADVVRLLAESGASPEDVELEITETMVMRSPERAETVMRGLADAGLRLAMDDFGNGYFALSHLKRYPVRTIKIAPAFVAGLPDQKDNVAILQALLSMARTFGLRVVAEGVERPEQRDFLRDAGCDALQGFLIAAPVDARDATALMTGAEIG